MPSGDTFPLWRVKPYIDIWNWNYRHPKLTEVLVPNDYKIGESGYPTGHDTTNSPLNGGENQAKYGFLCPRIKTSWSTGIVSGLAASDKTINIPVSGTADLDIIEIEQTKQFYASEVDREYFGVRYKDIMRKEYGAGVPIEADPRPRLLNAMKFKMPGYDIDGTGDANVGNYSGKGMVNQVFRIPRTFIPEHGTIWVVALVRFEPAVLKEVNPITKNSAPTFEELAAPYEVAMTKEPKVMNDSEFFAGSTSNSLGTIPWGEHYRYQPNNIHNDYQNINGYPFLKQGVIDSHRKAVYCIPNEYDSVFLNQEEQDWQVQSFCRVTKFSRFPTRHDSRS